MPRHGLFENSQPARQDYLKTVSQYHAIKQQINQLDFKSPTAYENESYIETSISSDFIRKLNETFKHIPTEINASNVEGGGVGENDRG